MDKIIEKKTGWRVAFTKKALPWWLGALLLVFVIYLIARPNNKTLRVDKDTVTISSAVKGEFNDYIRISGRVQPMTTIQLSPQEGGIVEKILIEEGSPVKAGDAILILNNDNLDLQILNSEAELAEKENILRNTQIQMEQQKLDVRQNVLEYGIQVERLRRAYEQQKALFEDKLIAREEYLKAEEDYQRRYQEGFEKGQTEGKGEYTEKIMDLIMSQVDSLAELENDMAQVVIDSVTKIIGELPDNEQIVRVVRKAINTVRGMKRVTIRVAPDDENAVRQDLGMLLVSPDGRTGYIDLVGDASMKHGDCILETPMGIINAGLEFQLGILKKSIQSRVQQNSAG